VTADLDRWLAVGDLDELLREVDRRCDRFDWGGVEELRVRARAAIERGHQLWPAASYAEYRLALGAPAPWAARVITDEAGYMAPGPLTEVAAQDHTWHELAPLLAPSARRALVAQERVLRGEPVPDEAAGELPGRLLGWEPAYALATYRRHGSLEVAVPEDVGPDGAAVDCPAGPAGILGHQDAEDATLALHGALQHWAVRSGGRVRAVGVEGGASEAIGALGHERAELRACSLAEASALLAWGAADGGAHGRRRGAATGRFELWWCLSVLAGIEDRWPCDPGPEAARLDYAVWSPVEAPGGWSCRIAVVDAADGLAWALDAHDPSPATA
jgi:hypothetical protein